MVSFRDLSPAHTLAQTGARGVTDTEAEHPAQPVAVSALGIEAGAGPDAGPDAGPNAGPDAGPDAGRSLDVDVGAAADANGLIDHLRAELGAARDDLLQTMAALHRSNDELLAYNEELLSANEELQAANAELLHSKNDLQRLHCEAQRANADLQAKVAAVERANDDINNLLSSTDLATIFLDAALCIKLFTPAAVRLFSLRDGDIGRPLTELSQIIADPELATDCREVLEAGSVVETEISARDGECCYLRRVQPYRTAGGGVDGIVIVYMDITVRAATELQLRHSERHYRTLFDHSPLCLIEQDWSDVEPVLASWRQRAAGAAVMASARGRELAQELAPSLVGAGQGCCPDARIRVVGGRARGAR